MPPQRRRQLVWHVVGVLCYFAGVALFLVVALDVFFAPPERSLDNLSTGHLVSLLAGLGLIVSGQVISWKLGGEYGGVTGALNRYGGRTDASGSRDQSVLEEMGYRTPQPEEDASTDAHAGSDEGVVCPDCGTSNEEGFQYCRSCSSELP